MIHDLLEHSHISKSFLFHLIASLLRLNPPITIHISKFEKKKTFLDGEETPNPGQNSGGCASRHRKCLKPLIWPIWFTKKKWGVSLGASTRNSSGVRTTSTLPGVDGFRNPARTTPPFGWC